MSVTTAQYVDLLFKKLQGVAKTANATVKSASNESIASPALLRGDIVWTQSSQIPSTAQVVANVTQGYLTTSRIECTADTTVPTIGGIYPTWLTNLQYWIPQEFGSTWPVKIWVDTAGASNPTVTGTQIFATGIGGVGEFFFDTQAGVLNFIGETIPATLTAGKSIFITGYRYVGQLGVTNLPSANIGNIQITGNSIATLNTNGDLVLDPNGTGNVTILATTNVTGNITATGLISVTGNVTAGNLNAAGLSLSGNVVSSINSTANITTTGNIAGGNISVTGTVTGNTISVSNISVSGNVTANYFVGNGSVLTSTMTDRGADLNNWDTMTQMGVYTVNRVSWSGTVGTPLDSQVFVGLVEVKNSTDTALAQVFYPGTVDSGNVKIQWNRTYWSGSWSSWIKIINDDQVVLGGTY